jgi:UTP--glucose-1-phosphate uridylyltransferase
MPCNILGASIRIMIRKAVITAAGLGTRLLSVTKAQPKEMLPVFARCQEGGLCMKPIVQLVFEDLFKVGFREFCFVVGRGQRTIREHFTPDSSFLSILDKKGKNGLAKELEGFYEMVKRSRIDWINQAEPRGFGDAVMKTKNFVNDDVFLVHAGDSYFISSGLEHLKLLRSQAESLQAQAEFLVQEVQDPRRYGVVESIGESDGLIKVKRVVEKPEVPVSRLAIMPVYMFQPAIFGGLREARPGYGGELQLTDGIEKLIESGASVYGLKLSPESVRLDVGSPDSYMEAQIASYKCAANDERIGPKRTRMSPIVQTV